MPTRPTLLLLAAVLGLALAPSARAQSVLTEWYGTHEGQRFGTRVAAAGDVNADGHADALVFREVTEAPEESYALVVSGADGATLHSFAEPLVASYARVAAGVGDVDDDGHDDVLVAAPLAARAWVYSGDDGAVIHDLVGPGAFGISADGVGDVDGDDRDDFVVGAPNASWTIGGFPEDRAFVLSGLDGAVIHTFAPDDTAVFMTHALGTRVASAGDTSGDGIEDVLVTSGTFFCEFQINPAVVRLYSGSDGTVLHEWTGHCSNFGRSLGAAGDVDGDGFGDALVGGVHPHPFGGGEPGIGEVSVFSGGDGSLIWALDGEAPNELLGSAVGGLGDRDLDGRDDLISSGAPSPGEIGSQTVRAFSGRDATELLTIFNEGRADAFAVLGDVDADGYTDFAMGAPFDGTAGFQHGRVRVWSGYVGWSDIGFGLPGTAGTPHLQVSGRLQAGNLVDVSLSDALPGGTAVLIVGLDLAEAPLHGGTLMPAPDVLVAGLPVDGAGNHAFTAPFPPGVPAPLTFWVQAWMADPGGPQGFAASNAVAGSTR